MMYVFAFIFGIACGVFCAGLASASKDEPMTEEDVEELLRYIDEKVGEDLQDL